MRCLRGDRGGLDGTIWIKCIGLFELLIGICNDKGGEYIIGGNDEYLSSLLIDLIIQFATIILPWVDNAD